MKNNFYPVSKPSITDLEIEYVTNAVKSTWISSIGEYIDKFEAKFAEFCQAKYAIAVSNGTVAIQLALTALDIGPGDEVIVPDLSFIATANAVLHVGAKPIFADVDPYNLCLDPNSVEQKITSHTKAIMPVHLYGHPADMRRINEIAKKNNLVVIEDAAEAHGASIEGKKVGSWGDCATFSFYGNKNITTGEGGMITTNNERIYERCKILRDHAMSKNKRYWHEEPGFNFRITNLQAAVGVAQMERSEQLLQKRKEIFQQYHYHLSKIEGISLNKTSDWATNTYWLVCLEVNRFEENSREKFIKDIREQGVDTRPYFYPMSMMPYFEQQDNPVSYNKYKKGINLPTYFELNPSDISDICDIIKVQLCSLK